MISQTLLKLISYLLAILLIEKSVCQNDKSCCEPNPEGCNNQQVIEALQNAVPTCSEGYKSWPRSCAEAAIFLFPKFCSSKCGNGICEKNEDCSSCSQDCGDCWDKLECPNYAISKDSSNFSPPDPLFKDQWHLLNRGQFGGKSGEDLNVSPAWNSQVTGNGVKIAIVDDGLQWTHPNLQCNFNYSLSFNFLNFNSEYYKDERDPSPLWLDDHGTPCAGVAAGRSDGSCGLGVAPDATLVGLRVLSRGFSDSVAAEALGHATHDIHIYSNSWGPSDNGFALNRFPLSRASIQEGAMFGRNGKGNIYMWAGGNGRHAGDDSNWDELANFPYVIAIAATDNHGKFSSYSEKGSNILVNAPSSSYPDDRYPGITTTDRLGWPGNSDHECYSSFGGTSAATPMVAGVAALMLSANPDLTRRDVMHIMVETATQNDPENEEWQKNNAGKLFNPNYGFGRVNAGKAIQEAKSWENISKNEWILKKEPITKSISLIRDQQLRIVNELNFEEDITIEHVYIRITTNEIKSGGLHIGIISPGGTKSYLSTGRSKDTERSSLDRYPFSSVQFWGENSTGKWTLEVWNTQSDLKINHIEFFIIGFKDSNEEPQENPPIDSEQEDSNNQEETSNAIVKESKVNLGAFLPLFLYL